MLPHYVESARLLGRQHGQKDMDFIAVLPHGIAKLRTAYAVLGRAKLVSGLQKAAGARAGFILSDQALCAAYRDGYSVGAIERVECLIFTAPAEW